MNSGNGGVENGAGAMALVEQGKTLIKNDVKYMTAVRVQKPRDIGHCINQAEIVVRRSPASMYYSWDIKTKEGSKTVEGGSIALANVVAAMLGNNIVECDVVFEDATHWIFKAYYIDLETGSTNTRLFRQRKGQVEGRYDDERKLDIAFQIGQSKAKRNIILESNKWLADALIETAKKAELAEIEGNLNDAKFKALKFFKDKGVTQAKIEAKMGRKLEDLDGGDVQILRGYARAVADGEIKIDDLFAARTEPKNVDASGLFEGATANIEPEGGEKK